ncbi:hypothetical protein EGW08_015826 [Elysia chlorotica]|uniref:DUF3456 domain-containing protein n=1 Tax=Elysia chlorotica TaxID=188477 RepID=A0A433T4G2_ELYCH|nr:hypothetical protein EGW08_015826 [Elysia chlorotica]
MYCMNASSTAFFLGFLLLGVFVCQSEVAKNDDPKSRKFSEDDRQYLKDSGLDPDSLSPDTVIIKPPSYTDEEETSIGMPAAYRCDGCRVISYQLQESFSKEEKKRGGSKALSESDLIDAVERVCKDEFESYGLMSTPTGEKFLKGPGLGRTQTSGSVDKGPMWPKRLRHMCLEILDVYDEDELYEMYRESGSSLVETELCDRYCSKGKRKTEL